MAAERNQNSSAYQIATVGLMAAFVYVCTNFRINIPLAIGKTMIHFGNVFCLLSGILLGPVPGGLAAGIGSGLFDLTSEWASSAPTTFLFKFFMGFACGWVARYGRNTAEREKGVRNLAAGVTGILVYQVFYIGKNFITDYYLMHNPLQTVLLVCGQKLVLSVIGGVIAAIIAAFLAPVFRTAMERAGIWRKLHPLQSAG